jgi:hypothetical protein
MLGTQPEARACATTPAPTCAATAARAVRDEVTHLTVGQDALHVPERKGASNRDVEPSDASRMLNRDGRFGWA